jgi:hypothetical protein
MRRPARGGKSDDQLIEWTLAGSDQDEVAQSEAYAG